MQDQLHAVGFSIFNLPELVKKDSRMGWTCPHCCLGISVRSTAPHHSCPFLLCPRESMFAAQRWFLSVLPVLGPIRWAITSHLCCLLAALLLSCQAGPASFIWPSRCLAAWRECAARVTAAPAHTCFGNTPRWARLWCELHRQHLSKRKSLQIWRKD